MTYQTLDTWTDDEVRKLGVDVPQWIDQDITAATVTAIEQGGCVSGAYMPAVTYYDARVTMQEHGDDVLQFIEDTSGELPQPNPGESWSGMAVFFLSYAIENWAITVLPEIMEALEKRALA